MKKKDQYKHFKNGDDIVCIKEGNCVFPELFDDTMDGVKLDLFHVYTFEKYLVNGNGFVIYDALVLKEHTPLYDGRNFMLLSEFRKLKLNKLKRRLYFKKVFGKFVKIK